MTRLWFAWAPCAALAACVEATSLPRFVALDPILDSVFVGDLRPLPNVTYFDGDKLQTPPASAVTWQSSDPAILAVNNPAGQVTGVTRGNALVIATVQNVQGSAIVAVSDPVDITLLLDTLYLLPNDTMTIPTIILHQAPTDPVVTYSAPSNTSFSVDANGTVTATGVPGGPFAYTVTAEEGSVMATATGVVYVLDPSSVGTGKAFFTVVGPTLLTRAVGHVNASPVAVNYTRTNGNPGFHMVATHAASTSSEQVAQMTLLAQVTTFPATFPIDSISPIEATTRAGDATCVPPRAWASRSSTASTAYSGLPDPGQQLSVTQIVSDGSGGQVMSGRFAYRARRSDLYTSPLGILRITGVFVAPLITDNSICP